MFIKKFLAIVVCLYTFTACGEKNDPPGLPDIAGNYTFTIEITKDTCNPRELGVLGTIDHQLDHDSYGKGALLGGGNHTSFDLVAGEGNVWKLVNDDNECLSYDNTWGFYATCTDEGIVQEFKGEFDAENDYLSGSLKFDYSDCTKDNQPGTQEFLFYGTKEYLSRECTCKDTSYYCYFGEGCKHKIFGCYNTHNDCPSTFTGSYRQVNSERRKES